MESLQQAIQKVIEDIPGLKKRWQEGNLSCKPGIKKETTPSEACPYYECDGSGWILWKDWSQTSRYQSDRYAPCRCFKQQKSTAKIKRSTVPEIFKKANIHTFRLDVYEEPSSKEIAMIAKEAAKKFILNFETMRKKGKGLYFHSETKGSGKTRLIASMTNAINTEFADVTAIYKKADDLLEEIKKTFDRDVNIHIQDVLDTFRDVDVLVIDDFGVEKLGGKNGWAERTWTDILDKRLEKKKVTLFSSNVSLTDLNEIYPAGRVKSRVEKLAMEITMPEESVREKEAEQETAEVENILFG